MTVWTMKVLLILQSKWPRGAQQNQEPKSKFERMIKMEHFVSLTVPAQTCPEV